MSNFTKEMIDDYADKLLIGLTEEERTNIQEEFDEIEKNMDLINKIPNIKAAEPLRINFSANDGVNEYKIQDNTKILKKNEETSVIEEAVCEYGTINMNEGVSKI